MPFTKKRKENVLGSILGLYTDHANSITKKPRSTHVYLGKIKRNCRKCRGDESKVILLVDCLFCMSLDVFDLRVMLVINYSL